MIKVELKEHANRYSLRSGRTGVWYGEELLAVGRGAVVCAAARELVKRGFDPAATLQAWRGNTLCLTGSLGTFARLTVGDSSSGRPRFQPYRAGPWAGRAAEREIVEGGGVGSGATHPAHQGRNPHPQAPVFPGLAGIGEQAHAGEPGAFVPVTNRTLEQKQKPPGGNPTASK